jgi:hypothetical protein
MRLFSLFIHGPNTKVLISKMGIFAGINKKSLPFNSQRSDFLSSLPGAVPYVFNYGLRNASQSIILKRITAQSVLLGMGWS